MSRVVFFVILALIVILAAWGLYKVFCGADGCFSSSNEDAAVQITEDDQDNVLSEGRGTFEQQPAVDTQPRQPIVIPASPEVVERVVLQQAPPVEESDEPTQQTSPQTGPVGIGVTLLSLLVAFVLTRFIIRRIHPVV